MDHCEQKKRKRNPRETANIFSLLTFSYTASLFSKGYKNGDLEEDDLYEVLRPLKSSKCGDLTEKHWRLENKKKLNKTPSIYRLMWARFGRRYLVMGFIHVCWKIFNSVVEPWAISNLIAYFKPGQITTTKAEAYYYAALVLTLHLFYTVYIHNYVIWVQQLGVEIKTSFSSLLYRKALRLTPNAVSEITLGNIVTLITKDVYAFQQAIWIFNDGWIAIVQTTIICYLLYAKIGVVAFIGIGVVMSILPLQVIIGLYVNKMRLAAGAKTDLRLQVLQETLSSIRIIKMYKWEDYFRNKIDQSRLVEINKMMIGFYLKMVILLLGVLFSKIGFYVLVISCIWMGVSTEAEIIFYLLSIFKDLKHSLGVIIPHSIGRGAELFSAISRINKVIKGEELPPKIGSDAPTDNPCIELKEATVNIREKCILKEINLSINKGLILVTGTVGSGKSSLLKTFLQDYPLNSGHILTFGRISYASQDPWLFPSSIKQNIVFGEEYNEKRYNEVVKVCALEYDLSLFERGDETIVTDKGLNLSKGQQARVNLARAVYKESEIYLLDDSLTALDAHVQDYIFKECIKTFLQNKICILVTQTVGHIQEADKVLIMNEGRIKYNGPPTERIIKEINEIVVEDDDLEKEVVENEKNDIKKMNGDAKPSEPFETEQSTKTKVYGEVNKKGEVDFSTYKKYIMFGGGFILMSIVILLFGLTQGAESYSDSLLTKWVDQQQIALNLEKNATLYNLTITENKELATARINEKYTIKLYSIMILVATLLVLIKVYGIFDFCRRASINIHKAMVKCIVYAVMAFFDTHFIGNILNRFSQDMTNIDEHLLHILTECIRVTFAIAGIVILIATVNPYFLIIALIFFSFLLFLRKLYLPTGRSLKRLEAASRSPMIGHLNASLEGLTTIRAYKAQNILTQEFDRHQDVFTSAHYTSLLSMRAFGFIMDFLCSIFILIVVIRFIVVDTGTSAGNVGLTLTQIFMLAGLVQWGVRTWADLENLMTSVERLLEYTEIPEETKEGKEMDDWPKNGGITYKNVSLTYNQTETVLKDLTFRIDPKQKIGIVGRTGAGKSSIISTIFRLYEPDGTILIDGVDIKSLSLKFLRKKLAIIPQDPVLFTGTIRSNIDPIGEFKDDELWNVLEEVNIKNIIPTLDMKITSSGGSNFSSGQKQLICLARAILRKTKIVVLDEATANMDHETDMLLHNTIQKNFASCTVLTIAHRLHSILVCDKVMVLDRGQIKEFDAPRNLLKNKEGIFYKMVSQAGLLNYLPEYITDLIKKGYYKKTIEEDDLYEVTKRCESKTCGDRIEEEYQKQKTGEKSPSLFHVLYKIYGFRYLLWGITQLIAELINRIIQPNAVSNLVYYFTTGQTKMTQFDAMCNAGMLLFANFYQKMYFHNYDLFLNLIGIEVRTSLCSFLFRKVLKLSPASVSQANLGNIVTLITKDVQQIKRKMFVFNDLWVFSLTVCTTCFLLYLKIGAVSLIASGVFICAIPLEVLIGKFINKLRTETCEKTDQRLQLTQEMLTAIKIIKMYAWEEFFERKIDYARRKELAKMLLVFYLRMILLLIGTIVSKIGLYLLIMAYIWMDEPADASVVFFITAHFETLRIYFAHLLPSSFGKIAEFSTTLSRINKVLQTEEISTAENEVTDFSNNHKPSIQLDNVTISIGDEEVIKNINFIASTGLTLITGKVGSGKSLLLKAMLQEYPLKGGELRVEGNISYASQNPWLFPSTIKQNILFGEKCDVSRYEEVLRVCALKYDFNLFEKGDETILTDNGQNLSKGQQARVNLARAVFKKSDIYLLDDCLSALDPHVRNFIFNECIKNFLKDKICILVTQDDNKFDEEEVFVMSDGALQKYISNNSDLVEDSNELQELNESAQETEEECPNLDLESHETDELLETEQTVRKNIYEEKLKKGGVDVMVYKKYISYGGGFLILLMNLLLIGFNQASDSYCEKLLSVWSDEKQRVLNLQINITSTSTNSSELQESLDTATSQAASTFRTYTIMLAAAVILELVRTYTFLDFCRRASIKIHESMVKNVLHATVSFFDSHFIGNILNRFSQDIINVDENLPFELSGSLGVLFNVGGAVVLLVSVNPYFLIYTVLLFCTYLIYSKIYLPVARNLQRLEASTRSPMIGHLNAALEGATTIRACQAEDMVINEYEKRQDVFTSAHYTLLNFQYAFAFFMQMIAAAMVTMVVSTFILFDTDASAGNIGLGLTQVISLGSIVQTTLKSWADLESTMTATERALEYTGIKTESAEGTISDNWPDKATIKYKNVTMSYNANEMVLNGLNFSVGSKEKIGIVGRTGAGKSSIVSTIFRLYDVEGTISIDDINIGSLPLKLLRTNLAIIPQDPFLFSGSIRSNLDPFGKFPDDKLWTVLERTHLKQFIKRLDADAGASNFSLGQKQMVCIARAILADSRIVILDEATANLDPDTERLIHKTISENFADCTVLIIAHRLETVLECDKIMVLDRGKIKEFNQPGVLLQDKNGWLSRMISQDDIRRK